MPTTLEAPSHRLRAERLEARISGEKKAVLQHAAELSGRTLSEFVVESAQAAATRVIEEHQSIRLSQDERVAFVAAVLAPAAPNSRLSQAATNYRQLMGL